MSHFSLIAWLSPFLALGLSAWLTWRFSKPGSRWHIVDYPNERSLHNRPTPRTGGVAIVVGIGASALLVVLATNSDIGRLTWLGAIALMVGGVSFLDDRLSLSPALRFVIQVIGAAILVTAGFSITSIDLPGLTLDLAKPVAIVVSGLFIVWMVNLYNFMDGIDGFAGGMAVIGFSAFAWFGWVAGNDLFMALSLSVVGAAIGFLFFNFPPARIFMGDVGSSVLGLLAAAMSLWGVRENLFPLWAALLVFSPFIVDATATLVRRLYKGEKVWQAHKTHYYQRLVQLGWGHRRTVLWEYVLMTACAGSAIWAITGSATMQWVVIVGWSLFYWGLAWFVIANESRNSVGP